MAHTSTPPYYSRSPKKRSPERRARASDSLQKLKHVLSKKPVAVRDSKLNPSIADHALLKHRSQVKTDQLRKSLDDFTLDVEELSAAGEQEFGNCPSPEEAASLIRYQSVYIKQLESELKFCKSELESYGAHLNQVLEENSNLLAAQQATQDCDVSKHGQTKEGSRGATSQYSHDLELLRTLHASKTDVLEQQLANTRKELHVAERKIDYLKTQMQIQDSMSAFSPEGDRKFGGLCINCGQKEALVAANQSDIIAQLTRDKEQMIETLANIRQQLSDMQRRENEAVQKVKVVIGMAEQANVDKTQALLQREQMHEELSVLKQRFDRVVHDHQAALNSSRKAVRNEVNQDIQNLESRLHTATSAEAAMKAELEKVIREKEDISLQLEKHRQEMQMYMRSAVESTTGRKVDMTQLALERDMAAEERNKLKNRLLKVEQVKDEAVLRVKQELHDVKSRLERAEQGLLVSNEENIRLVRLNQQIDKELQQIKMAYNSIDRSRNDEIKSLTHRIELREEELNAIINGNETRYSKQLNELENMYCCQNKLVGQLREECQVQAETIQQMSAKYRQEIKQLEKENASYAKQLEKLKEQVKVMGNHEVEHARIHKKLREKLQQVDDENRALVRETNELVAKNSECKREIEILGGEVKFLRCHVGTETPSNQNMIRFSSPLVVDDLLQALKGEIANQDASLKDSINILKGAARGDH